jgi:initiation factor 1A
MPRGVKTARSVRKATAVSRELVVRQDHQHYGIVTKLLGNNRILVNIIDGKDLIECPCTIRGSMRRREWIHVNDVVLVACRGMHGTCQLEEKEVHDVVVRYREDEVLHLKRFGELVIPEKTNDFTGEISVEHDIVFEDVDDI